MNISPELIEKYYRNSCTAEELKTVEEWLAQEETVQEAQVLHAVRQELIDVIQAVDTKPIYTWPKKWIGVAAAILFFFMTPFIYQQYCKEEAGREYVYSTSIGEQKRITLEDGTIVTLNAGSELKWDNNFDEETRVVQLKGEALFEVASNPAKPFLVVGDYTTVEVLGTVFNFKSYLNNRFELAVLEGKVKVTDALGDSHILLANNEIHWFGGRFGTMSTVDAAEKVVWRNKILLFDNTPLLDVAETIERYYGHKIIIADPALKSQAVSARFEHLDLQSILETLAFSLKLEYKIDQQKNITLYGKN